MLLILAVLPYALALRPVFYGSPIINGISIAKVPRDVAQRRLKVLADRLHKREIELVYRSERWLTTPEQLQIAIDYQQPLNEAWRIGRQGSPIRRWREILFTKRVSIPLKVHAQPQRILEQLYTLTPEIERPPINASFDLNTGVLLPERPGRSINLEPTLPRLTEAVRSNQNRRLSLVFTAIAPQTTGEDLNAMGAHHLLASYTTIFDPSHHVRAGNIRRGAQQINGRLLPAGNIFSFNKTTGPRDKAHGYGEALEIINEQFVPGVGGGICQVSTTLYNTVLLAGLKVVERHPHSLPLGYVASGRDATVYYGRIDFSFQNNTRGNLLILTDVQDDRVTVALMGEEKIAHRVEIETEILEEIPFTREWRIDENLHPEAKKIDRPGKNGIKVQTERLFYEGEQLIQRELLSIDTYKAQAEIVRTGSASEKR